jgi:hypothetical protein
MVTHTLRETSYFDFDKTEAATASNCNKIGGAPSSGRMESAGGNLSPQELHLSQQDQLAMGSETSGDSSYGWSSFNLEVENEADRMLEQAEVLSMNAKIEYLLDLNSASD